ATIWRGIGKDYHQRTALRLDRGYAGLLPVGDRSLCASGERHADTGERVQRADPELPELERHADRRGRDAALECSRWVAGGGTLGNADFGFRLRPPVAGEFVRLPPAARGNECLP